MKNLFILLLIPFLTLVLSSCGEDATSEEQILEYLQQNQLSASSTPSGLFYIIEETGTDPKPTSTSEVTIDYHGYLLDGTVFDSSVDRGEPLTISLTQTIAGWREGIPLFGTGGRGTIFIPASLGYGSRGSGAIPPNAVIAFDIRLISFE